MIGKLLRLLFLFLIGLHGNSQTTDLSIILEAQDINGSPVSQVTIYEEFQYVVTIANSGNTVSGSSFALQLDNDLTVNSFVSQNNSAGASPVSGFNLSATNLLTGVVMNMPNNSSVEVLVNVSAPTNLGGIAASTTVNAPDTVTDTNTSNNTSIISIDVVDVLIDFSVTHSQIIPTSGTPINAWGNTVTYQFTITNNSPIDFPLESFSGNLRLTSEFDYGQPTVRFQSMQCLSSTNGTDCPDVSSINQSIVVITSTQSVFSFNTPHLFTSGGSVTFEMVYEYLEPICGLEALPLEVESFINIDLDHDNESSNASNAVTTNLIEADLCPLTDICIETVQIDPALSETLVYGEPITFETTVCNNGPMDAPMRFFLQNITAPNPLWTILSADCVATTGTITCDDISIILQDQVWVSNNYIMPANSTITIISVVEFIEPECSSNTNDLIANVRSVTNLLDSQLVDTVPENNFESDFLTLPGAALCPTADIGVTKIQTNPALPEGSTESNTAEWGAVTYEIAVTNASDLDAIIELKDFMPIGENNFVTGTLTSVECIATTGSATCFDILNTNIGIELDGITDDGDPDMFWEILPEDNWELPANSSVTFEVIVDWSPECTTDSISGVNTVEVNFVNGITDTNVSNNISSEKTFFAPCIDLIVQTFPEFTQVNINQTFDWIVDISNSTTSSDAVDVLFENTINPVFDIIGTPTCTVTSGNATCITNYTINGNIISGIVPTMESGSTIQIRIPVMAPSFGGAYNNIAEAIVSAANNEELTPETNISISNVQIIAPVLEKVFNPDVIIAGNESLLTFTVTNLASNSQQNSIAFLDNLPSGIVLTGSPFWQEANGCTATFIGSQGEIAVGVTELSFPEGVSTCTFAVLVTSDNVGDYLNNNTNFTDNNNIDTSQTRATLSVIEDTSNVDIEILKTVNPTEAAIGDEVTFIITTTNLGTTVATDIEIIDQLPNGYEYISATTSLGVFDDTTFTWTLLSLFPNESATLNLVARVISSNDLLNIALLDNLNEVDRDTSNNEDDAFVIISDCLFIPEGISPNDDRKNDVLVIPCIEDYPENTLKIFNRYGAQIYQSSGYLNNWDGKANMGFSNSSKLLPVGTYYYILEINGFEKPFVGYVYLNY
jgi:uncharacterized repeat protein (TIGR01451 family)/gliding motility-associated-like protein